MKRVVALKVVSARAMKDEAAVKRFQREVEAAARLEHPNIVTAHDSRQDRGIHYLVMQYIEGSDLADVVVLRRPAARSIWAACSASCKLPVGWLMPITKESTIAISSRPICCWTRRGSSRFSMQVGLACLDDAATESPDPAPSRVMRNSRDYMSPEQAASTHTVDARTDMYSLGCTLWYLLTGRKIFEGATVMSRMLKHREAPVPSLRSARDDVPAELERLFERMVAKLPEDRFRAMDDVVRELEQLQPGASGLSQLAVSKEQGASDVDEFLQGLTSATAKITTGVRTAATPGRATIATGSDTPTVDFGNAGGGTDPASQISLRPLAAA